MKADKKAECNDNGFENNGLGDIVKNEYYSSLWSRRRKQGCRIC